MLSQSHIAENNSSLSNKLIILFLPSFEENKAKIKYNNIATI